ncbi:hypothetical protein [Burkholderia oklahomensis]|uniref:hypothetical protein n=1 Tax=Burkholderia oklahomensis TaxID=342113 RepID=UPI000B0BEA65|nr:hypothetical protein [Burkholderia oklahomensis]
MKNRVLIVRRAMEPETLALKRATLGISRSFKPQLPIFGFEALKWMKGSSGNQLGQWP